jgi:hypothetical protein
LPCPAGSFCPGPPGAAGACLTLVLI